MGFKDQELSGNTARCTYIKDEVHTAISSYNQQHMVHSLFLRFITPFSNNEKLSFRTLYWFDQRVYNQHPMASMNVSLHGCPPPNLGFIKLLWATVTTLRMGHPPHASPTHTLHAEPLFYRHPPFHAQAPNPTMEQYNACGYFPHPGQKGTYGGELMQMLWTEFFRKERGKRKWKAETVFKYSKLPLSKTKFRSPIISFALEWGHNVG